MAWIEFFNKSDAEDVSGPSRYVNIPGLGPDFQFKIPVSSPPDYEPRGETDDEEELNYPWLEWYNTSLTTPHHFNTTSRPGEEAGQLYQAIIQGVLVCLFTTVGGVMLVVFCLIVVQECKLLYVWAVRRHNEEVAPPSYLEVTKPPSYSSCQPENHRYNRFHQVDGGESVTSLTETEPPAYSDLYSRENSQLDRLVICDGVSTLVHSSTMSDINMDLLDWRPSDSSRITIHDNIIQHHVMQEETSRSPDINMAPAGVSESEVVQGSSSMFTIITSNTPLKTGEKKNKFYSLEMFKLPSSGGRDSSGCSSCSGGEEDSVPLLDDVNIV